VDDDGKPVFSDDDDDLKCNYFRVKSVKNEQKWGKTAQKRKLNKIKHTFLGQFLTDRILILDIKLLSILTYLIQTR
jgi:hypothetical protein